MSRASVTVTPSKRSCPRSRSRRTAADRLVGRSASWSGSAKWPVMTIRAPASSAARNGTSSRSASSAFVRGTSGSSWCGSAAVSPAPGKCLAVAATPSACRPRTVAAASRPTASGIVAEAADPERRIGRVVGHVAHRRVVHVDAEGPQLARRRAGDTLGQRFVAGRAERHRARERRRPVAQADQLAALLVGGDQQRWRPGRPCLLDRGGQPADLGRIDDVVDAEERDARDALFADPPRRRRRQLGAGEGDHEPRQGHDLTEPARIPRTKNRCSARNTTSGTIIVRNAPAVSRCHAPP